MSNVEARQWYLAQDGQILNRIDSAASLESQARQAFDMRNANRAQAREFMSDRVTADRLIREEPNLAWNQMMEYRRSQGLTGNNAYRSILQSSQKTRVEVNRRLGVE
jgi:filamentous hemagglutinin